MSNLRILQALYQTYLHFGVSWLSDIHSRLLQTYPSTLSFHSISKISTTYQWIQCRHQTFYFLRIWVIAYVTLMGSKWTSNQDFRRQVPCEAAALISCKINWHDKVSRKRSSNPLPEELLRCHPCALLEILENTKANVLLILVILFLFPTFHNLFYLVYQPYQFQNWTKIEGKKAPFLSPFLNLLFHLAL